MNILEKVADKVRTWSDKVHGVIQDLGVVENYHSEEDGFDNEVRALLRKPEDHVLFTLESWRKLRSAQSEDCSDLYHLDFDARGTNGLYDTLQKIKNPSAFASPEPTPVANSAMRNKSIWERFCQWIKSSMQMPNVVKEFGVISNFVDEKNKRACKVKALLRKPKGQTVLTLEFSTRHYGERHSAWIDFDDEGIDRLEQVIERLQERG